MRVAYLVHFRGGRETGIYRKVREHVTEWSRQGADVGLFVATDRAGRGDWASIPETKCVELLPARSLFSLVARERLALALRRWRPDIVYARHGLVYPGFILTARAFPTVIEINSDDLSEFQLTSAWRYKYGMVSRSILLAAAAGFVFVTNELARSPRFTVFKKPFAVIANGIDLSAIEPLPAPRNARPRLFFSGHAQTPWHGLEHVGELARRFPEWQFELVGPDPSELPGFPQNCRFHGTMSADGYWPIAAGTDVALGTLGLYRKSMAEASPLKVREYLALGIPTIVGYLDTDFPDSAPFLLQIPNEPNAVIDNAESIHSFVDRATGTRVPREAIQHLDVRKKEADRLAFLATIARRP